MTTGELAEMCGGALVAGDPARVTQGVSIDSRTIEKDEFFLAIEGHRFNGHDFAEIAVEQGAAGVIGRPGKLADLAARLARPAGLIEVGDPLAALHELARSYRAKFDIPIVAVAGSCGKTTTKDMLASILGQTKSVVATQGNLNNFVGVPLTLLRIGAGAEAAVLEIASNAPGEIERLAWVIAPTAGIITNIGPVHLEGFGDMEGVFKEKSSLAPHVSSEGFLVATDIKQEIGGGAEFTLNGAKTLRIPLVGAHNVLNALAAIAAATRLGVEPDLIRAGLERFSAQPMRMEVSRYRGAAIVNDAYNANPRAMREAISTVTDAPAKRKILALGDMLELGEFSVVAHRSLGQFIARAGVDLLYACGEFAGEIVVGAMEAGMQAERVLRCDGPDEIAASLKYILGDGDILLVKGSRGMRMERIVQLLSEEG
jgi:UDP-N-acetylmuramoyl-tripeptide--D-alanyl-D-alanine ligase